MSYFIATVFLSENSFHLLLKSDTQIVSYRVINYSKVDSDHYY